ncbi:hypothetical protein FA13DRAFT_1744855, partial [Coprinellus micaceus]
MTSLLQYRLASSGSLLYGDSNLFAGFSMARLVDVAAESSKLKTQLPLPQELIDSLVDLVQDDRNAEGAGFGLFSLVPSNEGPSLPQDILGETQDARSNTLRCERLYHVLKQHAELPRLINRLTLGDEKNTHIARVLPLLISITQLYHHVEDLIMQDVRPSAATSATRPRIARSTAPTVLDPTHPSELRLTFGQCAEALKTLIACASDSEATLPLFRRSMVAARGPLRPFVMAYTIHQNETKQSLVEPSASVPPLPPMALPLSRFPRLRIQAIRSFGKPWDVSHIVFDIDFNVRDDQLAGRWSTLDLLLSDSSVSKIEEVTIGFSVKRNISEGDTEWQSAKGALLRAMMNLGRSKAVKVDFEVDLDDS